MLVRSQELTCVDKHSVEIGKKLGTGRTCRRQLTELKKYLSFEVKIKIKINNNCTYTLYIQYAHMHIMRLKFICM